MAYVALTGNVVKVQPLSVISCNDALGTQNDAVGLFFKQRLKDAVQLIRIELFRGLHAPTDKYVVGVVVMVMMTVVVMMTGAVGIVTLVFLVMVVMMLMVMIMMVFVLIFIMVVVVMAAAVGIITFVFVVMMVMLMLMFVFVVVMMLVFVIIVVVVMVTAAVGVITLILVVMMVMFFRCFCKTCQLFFDGVAAFHSRQKLCAVQLVPRRGDDCSRCVVFAQECDGFGELLLVYILRV